MIRRRLPPRPKGLGGAAGNDHQTAIPKTDEQLSRDWKRNEQRPEGGHEPSDGPQVYCKRPKRPRNCKSNTPGARGKIRWREIWPQAEAMLAEAPDLEAKTLFEYLWERSPWAVQEKHLRTFQRRVKLWRLRHGPDQEVFFPQDWEAGRALQMDWTHAAELAITLGGQPYDHLLCHCVLPHSNWEWATPCLSESLLSCKQGLQEALHRLGKVPQELRVDNSSAATHRVGGGGTGREFNQQFLSLCEHFGLRARTIGINCPNENGDVESSNGHLKRRLRQRLLLRGQPGFRIGSGLRTVFATGVGARQSRAAGEAGGGVGADEAAAADPVERI